MVNAVKAAGGDFVGVLDCVSIPGQSLDLCNQVLEKLGGGKLGNIQPHVKPEVSKNVEVINVLGMGEMTHIFWKDYITPALENGSLKCLPEPYVVGHGFEWLQTALDTSRKGISAKNVVVTL